MLTTLEENLGVKYAYFIYYGNYDLHAKMVSSMAVQRFDILSSCHFSSFESTSKHDHSVIFIVWHNVCIGEKQKKK